MAQRIFERHLNFLDYALSSLWRKKLKNFSVMLVFAAVIFLLASFQLLVNGLLERADTALALTPEILVQKMTAGRQDSIPLSYKDRIEDILGVRQITPRVWGYYFDEVTLANYTVIGMDISSSVGDPVLTNTLQGGRMPYAKGEVVLGGSVVSSKGLDNDQIFSLFRPDLTLKTFNITGVFKDQTSILTDDLMVMSISDGRDLFGIPDSMATDLLVNVVNAREIDTISRKIAETLPDTRVLTRQQIRKTYQMVFGWRSGVASICLLTALAAFVIFSWDKASGLSPEERKEIAILKILGWQTSDIMILRFWEGAIISITAFLIGCTAAYIHVVFFSTKLFLPVLAGWSVIRPDLKLFPQVHLADFLLLFCFTVMPYLAATVVPAWRCASLPSDTALQGG